MDEKIINKRGQIAIFIIVAILIVAVVALFFKFRVSPTLSGEREFNPETYIEQCLRQEAIDKINLIVEQGGFFNPLNYKIYNDVKATYLCENINYYEPCINQHPALLSEIENELNKEMNLIAGNCFASFKEEATRRNFVISGEVNEVIVELRPGFVETSVFSDLVISSGENSQSFSEIKAIVQTPLTDLAYVASEIVRQEAQFCHFSTEGYSLLYRDFDVRRNIMSDSTKIYTIKHRDTARKMHIAIRGCAIPAGF